MLQVGGAALAVIRDQPSAGIFFGTDGWAAPLAPGKERSAKCKLGPMYARMPDGGKSLFAAEESPKGTLLTSLRVYVAEGAGEVVMVDGCTAFGQHLLYVGAEHALHLLGKQMGLGKWASVPCSCATLMGHVIDGAGYGAATVLSCRRGVGAQRHRVEHQDFWLTAAEPLKC